MKKGKNRLWGGALILAGVLVWAGCSNPAVPDAGGAPVDSGTSEDYVDPPEVTEDSGDVEDAALAPNSQTVSSFVDGAPLVITLSENDPVIAGGESSASAVYSGGVVAVTLSGADADIVLQGISGAASVQITGDYNFNLYLNGAGLTASGNAAVSNNGKGAMNVTLVEGTSNRLIDGAASGGKAALYSAGNLTIGGSGALEVRGKIGHAIAAKGAFVQNSGSVWAKSAVKDGINAKTVTVSGGSFRARVIGDGIQGDDGVTITGGEFDIVTTDQDVKANGIKSDENIVIGTAGAADDDTVSLPKLTVSVYGNGSKAISADGNLTIHSGDFALYTSGGGFWDTSSTEADKISTSAGLKCDGTLTINGGKMEIISSGLGGKGISADGDIIINGGDLSVTTTGKTYTYSSAYDTKAKAIKSDTNITINDGTIVIRTYTDGAEGLECEYNLTINGGTIEINSYDDAINASGGSGGKGGVITISGGRVYCNSSNNDGIDSNGTITVSGGTVISFGTTAPEEGFDCDNNTFTVTGGTLIGMGGATSKPTTGTTTVCTVECNAAYSSLYRIEAASDGAEVMTFKSPRSYSGTVCLLFAGSGLASGGSYTLYSGGSVSGGSDFHGLYTGAAYTKGSSTGTFTASPYATIGTASGSPGAGGQPGQPGRPPR